MMCRCRRLALSVISFQELGNLCQYSLGIQTRLAQTFTAGAMLDKGIGEADIEYQG